MLTSQKEIIVIYALDPAHEKFTVWNKVVHSRNSHAAHLNLGGVYMTLGRLLRRCEFTPVPSHGSTFVYMIPPQNVMLSRVTPAWNHPGCCTRARISLQYEISQWYHVNAKRSQVSVWNRSASRLEWVVHAWCLQFWITHVFYQHEMYLQITRYEMTQSSCKCDMKSKSHPSMKLALVRVSRVKAPYTLYWVGSCCCEWVGSPMT